MTKTHRSPLSNSNVSFSESEEESTYSVGNRRFPFISKHQFDKNKTQNAAQNVSSRSPSITKRWNDRSKVSSNTTWNQSETRSPIGRENETKEMKTTNPVTAPRKRYVYKKLEEEPTKDVGLRFEKSSPISSENSSILREQSKSTPLLFQSGNESVQTCFRFVFL